MNNECCGSQLHHTGVCCQDENVSIDLVNQVFSAPEEKPLKDCACQGLGPCQCPPEEKKKDSIAEQFKDLTYAGTGCGCGGNCGCN